MDSYAVKPARLHCLLPTILAASQWLRDVVLIEASFRLNDKPNTLHYFDPPYFKTEKMYRPVFSEEDHHRLHDLVPRAKGYTVISYNNDEFIVSEAQYLGGMKMETRVAIWIQIG